MKLTFAIGPVHVDADGEHLRRRIAMSLVDRLERPVEVIGARSYADVASMIARNDAHLAWLPPAVYVRVDATSPEIQLLAKVDRSGGDGYRGVLFVPKDAPQKELADLRGARVAWVDRDSCAGHLFVRLALRERGHEPSELFGHEQFAGSHTRAVRAVLDGDADVGATHAQTLDGGQSLLFTGWHPFVGAEGMRPLLISDPIPSDVVCGTAALGADLLDEVREALLHLHEDGGDELLDEFFGGPRLVPTSRAAYDPVRAAMK